MSSKRPEKIWGLVYNMMKSVSNDVPTILRTLDQVLSQKPTFEMRFDHEGVIPGSFVIWLVNQLLNFAARPLSNRIRKQNVLLQKKLMNFCYTHMPQLFETLLIEYRQSLSEFIEVCYLDTNKLKPDQRTVNTFTCANIEFFKEIDAEFKFEKITVSLDMADLVMQSILEVLTQSLIISFNTHQHLFEKALKIILELFLYSDTYTKLHCLDFSVQFFDNLFELNNGLSSDYVILFEYCQLMWENLTNWMNFGYLDEFGISHLISTSSKLLKCNCKTFLSDKIDSKTLEALALSCETILRSVIKNEERLGDRVELKADIINYILELHEKTGCLMSQQSLTQLIQSDHQVVKLLGTIQDKDNDSATVILTKALKGDKSDFPIAKHFLNMISDMEHKSSSKRQAHIHSTIWLGLRNQIIHNDDIFTCNNLDSSVKEFLENAKKNHLNLSGLCDYIEISGLFLQTYNLLKILSADLQISLIDVMLFYLRHHLKIEQHFELAVEDVARTDDKLIEISLEALANVAQQHLDTKVESYFQKSAKEVICMIYPSCHNEAMKTKLNEKLLDFLANSVISIKLIVCHILPVIVKSPINSEVLFKIKCICCCALGNVFILRTRSANRFAYHFLCEDCEKPCKEKLTDYFQNKTAVLMQHQAVANSFDESALVFVLNAVGGKSLFGDKNGVFAINHFSSTKIESQVLSSCLVPEIVKALVLRTSVNNEFPLLPKIGLVVLQKVQKSIEKGEEEQMNTLRLISVLATIERIPELWLFHFYKMIFFYMICCESAVSKEAAKCTTEMCASYGVEPIQLWYWYKRECLSLVVDLSTHVYLKKGQGLLKTLNSVSELLSMYLGTYLPIYLFFKQFFHN